ncbi:MAG TPA: hypothetical protein VJC21_02690 [Candidatus Nanoarchaeia archaeon]|nr:hypothetical protein [Candidatus Nanoarchaeia archaeon]
MGKKEVILPSRHAQVTIFIILGIVIFLIFVFLFLITARIKQAQLLGEKEEVLGRVFNKEALRLFVDSCLEQSLERGISLLGQDGTIWQDHGGIFPFQDSFNGIDLGAQKVAYGIRREQSVPENLYPCNMPLFPNSGFCPYRFPDVSVGFGELSFPSIRSYEKDLENFLKKDAVSCVEEWIQGEIYPGAQIVGEETVQMHVDITDTSIIVDAKYPLTFEAAGQEFFHLSEFGFVYPSRLGSFLKAAIVEPLRWEQKYVKFNYEQDVLQESFQYRGCPEGECTKATFADILSRLQVSVDVAVPDEATGDTIFTFLVQEPNAILKNQPTYAFSIAIQNRPPALDYVEKASCVLGTFQDYDYFALSGDPIDITLTAHDPDDDGDASLSYEFPFEGLNEAQNEADEDGKFLLSEGLTAGSYTLTASVSDHAGLKDWQDIRILVSDTPPECANPQLVYGVGPS